MRVPRWLVATIVAVAVLAGAGAVALLFGAIDRMVPAGHVMAATRGSGNGALSVPAWYIDHAGAVLGPSADGGTTACASDTNTCQSPTCGAFGSGLGPCSTLAEVVGRWGTDSPKLPQSTTIQFLSDDTSEPIVLRPTMVGAGPTNFGLLGSYVTVSTGTLGTVTPKARNTRTLLQANLGAPPTVGTFVHDTTRSIRATVFSAAGNVATLTQPFAAFALAIPGASLSPPAEVDTIATSDAFALERPVSVNLQRVEVTFVGSNNAGLTLSSVLWIQALRAIDPTGPGATNQFVGTNGGNGVVVDDVFDGAAVLNGDSGYLLSALNPVFTNPGYTTFLKTGAAVVGGGSLSGYTLWGAGDGFTQDSILMGGIGADAESPGTTFFLGTTYVTGVIQVGTLGFFPSTVTLFADGANAGLWGSASIAVRAGGAFYKSAAVSSFATALANLTGAITIDGASTASNYVGGTWTSGVTISPTNLDAHGGLVNPVSGSRIAYAP